MSDLQIIRKIEKKIGDSLKQLTWDEFQKLRPESKERSFFGGERREPQKLFVLDEQENVLVLWLDSSPVSIYGEIKQLTELKHLLLDRYDHKWKISKALVQHKNLIELDLGGNRLKKVAELQKLTSLQILNLSFNRIDDLSPLKQLNNLQQLDLMEK